MPQALFLVGALLLLCHASAHNDSSSLHPVLSPNGIKTSYFEFPGVWSSEPIGFAQAVVVKGPTQRVYIAGQAPFVVDPSSPIGVKVVPENDVVGQFKTCLENMKKVLESLGGSLDDVVSADLLVKGWDLNKHGAGFSQLYAEYWNKQWAGSLYGVADLAFPGQLVEVSAIAEVPLKK